MSRARKIPEDLHTVAQLAGTSASVLEGAAIAAEKAQAVSDVAAEVKEHVAKASKGRRKGLLILLFLAVLAAVGIVIWKKSSGGDGEIAEVTDLRADAPDFAGSMP